MSEEILEDENSEIAIHSVDSEDYPPNQLKVSNFYAKNGIPRFSPFVESVFCFSKSVFRL